MKEAREPLLLVGICIDWAPWENQPYQQLARKRSQVPYQSEKFCLFLWRLAEVLVIQLGQLGCQHMLSAKTGVMQ